MLVSFTVPVYGTESRLPRCLASLAAQTDSDFEAVVVDDGSPDFDRLPELPHLPNLRIVRHGRNRSLFQARITGLKEAKGDFVVPLDSDDCAGPELVARLRHELSERPETDVAVFQMARERNGRVLRPEMRLLNERMTGADAIGRLFASRLPCAICGKAVRRKVYAKAVEELAVGDDFYLNSSEDLCQTFPVLANAKAVSTLDCVGYVYSANPESLTETLTDPAKMAKAAENTRRVFDTLADFVRRTGRDAALVDGLEKFVGTTLEWYLGCIRHQPEGAWRACAAELCRFFPPDLVARRAMTLIESSRTFRLGRALTGWLRPHRTRR